MTNEGSQCRASLATLFTVFCLLGLLLPRHSQASEPAQSLRITVAVPPLVWLVSEVAGPGVTVESLVEPGEIPETFEPSDLRITGLARSALFFRVGATAENAPWLRALEKSGSLEVIDLRQGLVLRAMEGHHGHAHGHGHGHGGHDHDGHTSTGPNTGMDPHVWLSPRRLEIMAGTIARGLATADPSRGDRYAERAAELKIRLRQLDTEIRTLLAPVRGRAFFVFHPAWGYFADDYGLQQVAIEIEGKEPSETELTHWVREARKHRMRTLFVEPQTRSATPEIVARVVGARVETLDPLAPDLPTHLLKAAERLRAALGPSEDEE